LAVVGHDGTSGSRIIKITSANIPGDLVDGIVYLDQYIFVATTAGYIHNSNVGDALTWTSGDRLLAHLESDNNVAIVKHLNYLVALGEWTTEFFYDASNPAGSPLRPVPGSVHKIGCAAGDTVFEDEDTVIWLSQSKTGGVQVVALNGMDIVPLSNPAVERSIAQEEGSIGSCYAYGMRIAGHLFYLLHLTSQDKTWVYNTSTQTWTEWVTYNTSGDTETRLYYIGLAQLSGQFYTLHLSNGNTYKIDFDINTDTTGVIKREVVTDGITLGNMRNKFCNRTSLIADEQTAASSTTVEWTDDDYKTYSTARTVDLADTEPTMYACGRFKKRAFRIKNQANTKFRITAIELDVEGGDYEGGNA
jgi:hypothetical protein